MKGKLVYRLWFSQAVLLTALINPWIAMVSAQSAIPIKTEESLTIKSWKVGTAKVAEKTITLKLEEGYPAYEVDFAHLQAKNKSLKLLFSKQIILTRTKVPVPCWIAGMREVEQIAPGAYKLGPDLLTQSGLGVADYIPREDFGSILCPFEKPNQALDGLYYPIRMERKFLIEGFIVSLLVTDYEWDKEQNKLQKLQLRIALLNQKLGVHNKRV